MYSYEQMKEFVDQRVNSLDKFMTHIIDTKPPGVPAVPSSIKVPHLTLLNKDKTFKSEDELREILQKYGKINDATNEKVICTCKIGYTTSTLAIALTQLGNTNVSLYDGAWQEWSSK